MANTFTIKFSENGEYIEQKVTKKFACSMIRFLLRNGWVLARRNNPVLPGQIQVFGSTFERDDNE